MSERPIMSAKNFRIACRLAGLSDADLELLSGARPDLIAAWQYGSEPVPWHFNWLLPLLSTSWNRKQALERARLTLDNGRGYDPMQDVDVYEA